MFVEHVIFSGMSFKDLNLVEQMNIQMLNKQYVLYIINNHTYIPYD